MENLSNLIATEISFINKFNLQLNVTQINGNGKVEKKSTEEYFSHKYLI